MDDEDSSLCSGTLVGGEWTTEGRLVGLIGSEGGLDETGRAVIGVARAYEIF